MNEDLNALQFTSTMNHTISGIMSVYMVIKLHCIACRIEWSIHYTEHVDVVVLDNNDTQCNTILLDNIVLINTTINLYIVIYGTHYPPPPHKY